MAREPGGQQGGQLGWDWVAPPAYAGRPCLLKGRQVPAGCLPVLSPRVGEPTPPGGQSWPGAPAQTPPIKVLSCSPAALAVVWWEETATLFSGGRGKGWGGAPGGLSCSWAHLIALGPCPNPQAVSPGVVRGVGRTFLLCGSRRCWERSPEAHRWCPTHPPPGGRWLQGPLRGPIEVLVCLSLSLLCVRP